MTKNILRFLLALSLITLFSCASTRSTDQGPTAPRSAVQASTIQGTAFGPTQEFIGSPYAEVGHNGLFDVYPAETCPIAVLPNGDDYFAARIQALKNADTSIRIQALIFTGDESGLYITELLKKKTGAGCSGHCGCDVQSGSTNAVDVF